MINGIEVLVVQKNLLFVAVAIGGTFALSQQMSPAHAQNKAVVFAAASTKNALDEIVQAFVQNQGLAPSISYAASSVLARQIEHGAPASVFISADTKWMDYLSSRKLLLDDTRFDFASNRLAFVAAPGYVVPQDLLPIRKNMPLAKALAGGQRLALANPAHVPAGRYAQAALESLGVWSTVADQIVPANNVRFALALVARGETPLGIVYRSDLYASSKARELALIPSQYHQPIRYPVAAVRGVGNSPAVKRFLQFLRSQKSREILTRFGFGEPSER